MKVFERLAEAFCAEGLRATFGMMGDGNMHWMTSLDKRGIRMYEVRHEGAGLGMADGWARVTREVAVATATQGPGVSQLATALLTASRASSPIVAFVGEYPTNDPESAQRLDQSLFALACESGFVRIATPDATDESVRRAFTMARMESRPVLLSVPMDVGLMSFDDDEPYKPARGLVTEQPVYPNLAQIEAAAELVAGSRRPVIIVGRGAQWAGAGVAVRGLAGRIGALVGTSLMAKAFLLAEEEFHVGISGLFGTRTALRLFEECDCVIGVGASMNSYTTAHGYLYPMAKLVHIDSKPHVLRSHGTFADCYVQSDARLGVEALEGALARRSFTNTGYRTPEVRQRLAGSYLDPGEFPIEAGLMDPREVCSTLDETIPTGVPLAMGSSNAAGFAALTFKRPRPYMMASGFFGCVGQMLPAALGAAAATGGPIFLVDGDVSVMMHLAEFETAVRYAWPILVVVQNNEALGSDYNKLRTKGLRADLAVIPCPDLGAVARSFGGKGRLVRNSEELRAAAEEWVANPCPMIIDARISRNVLPIPFRRTVLGVDV